MYTKLAVALLLGVVSNAALANDVQRPYAFATLGQASYDGASNSPIAIRIGGGYNITEVKGLTIGVEGAYADFGKATSSTSTAVSSSTFSVKTTGLMVNGVVSYALPNVKGVSILGKLGVLRASSSGNAVTSVTTFFGTTTTATSFSGTSTGTFFGFGVKYDITRDLEVRATYEDYGSASNGSNGTSSNLSLISAGVAFKF